MWGEDMNWKPISELPPMKQAGWYEENAVPILVWLRNASTGVAGRCVKFQDGTVTWSQSEYHGDWGLSHWLAIEPPEERGEGTNKDSCPFIVTSGEGTSYCRLAETAATQLPDLLAKVAFLLKALEPFAHPDLCRELGGNLQGDESLVFGRGDAVLKLGDFRRATEAIKEEK